MHKYKVIFYAEWRKITGCIIEAYDESRAEKLAAYKLQDEIKAAESKLNLKVNRSFVTRLPDNQHRR